MQFNWGKESKCKYKCILLNIMYKNQCTPISIKSYFTKINVWLKLIDNFQRWQYWTKYDKKSQNFTMFTFEWFHSLWNTAIYSHVDPNECHRG